MLNPTRHHRVTRTTDANAGTPPDCQDGVGRWAARSAWVMTPVFSSKISSPMSAVATPETAIGRMKIDRKMPRAGSTELSSNAASRPSTIDAGVTISVNSTVLSADRQNSGSESRRL